VTVTGEFRDFRLERQSIGTAFSFPLGQWAAEDQLVGDLSGGDVRLTRSFDRAYIYSWEGVSADKPVASGGQVQTIWFPFLTTSTVGWTHAASIVAIGTQETVVVRDSRLRLPLSAQNPRGVVQASVIIGDNSDGGVFTAKIWGHFWDKRAYLSLSGPIRP